MNPLAAALELHRRPRGRSASAYAGAELSRLTADWVLASIRSADNEIRWDLRTLRRRARELCRNNPHASRFLDVLGANVIGHHGIRFQSTVRTASGDLDVRNSDRIEEAWARWGKVGVCTADGRASWTDVSTLAVQLWAQDGETIVRKLPGFDNEFGFAVQILDADQLDETYNRAPDARRNEIRMGVEMNAWGRPVAYHIWNRHPQDFQAADRERVPIPASEILHIYRPRRAGQSRGVPALAPVMIALHMVGAYEEAELVASRVASAKGGFFEQSVEAASERDKRRASQAPIRMEAEPGVFDVLPPGWSFSPFAPDHPTSAFRDFRKGILQSIASGLGPSYNVLANDWEGVSYNSLRAAALTDHDIYRGLQWFVVEHFADPVFLGWLTWALTTGALELPSRDPRRWSARRWQPRGWDWVDPEKDLRASAMALRLKLDSHQRMAAERGLDFFDVLREHQEAERMAESLGLELSTDVSRSGAAGGAARDDDASAELTEFHRNGNSRHAPALNGNGRR
ncbi:MAG TPA: phage portal protein [Longimicrobiales bacterium]